MDDDPFRANGTIEDYQRAQDELFGENEYSRHEVPGGYVITGPRSFGEIPYSAGSPISLISILLSASLSRTHHFHARTQADFNSVHPLSEMADRDQEDPKEEDEEQSPRMAVASALGILLRNSAARVVQLVVRVCISVPVSTKCALLVALDAGE
jgi:hypothetical protein